MRHPGIVCILSSVPPCVAPFSLRMLISNRGPESHAVAVILSFNFNPRRNPTFSRSGSDAFLSLFSNAVIVSQFLLVLSPRLGHRPAWSLNPSSHGQINKSVTGEAFAILQLCLRSLLHSIIPCNFGTHVMHHAASLCCSRSSKGPQRRLHVSFGQRYPFSSFVPLAVASSSPWFQACDSSKEPRRYAVALYDDVGYPDAASGWHPMAAHYEGLRPNHGLVELPDLVPSPE
ncbi:hypothetical protein B0T10DRAFT_480520 [Thelonectria olida]|uniref:Uncharacterized protein n=1 Tax=Thelonectria olida TaxID=1576542 RepID=A0A9P9AQ61_9HYPO|nr:hypothetical protein B0T10DRAFT_480520 [Thelonectria olida]